MRSQAIKLSPIFLAIVGLTVLGGGLAWSAGANVAWLAYVGVFVMVIAGWVLSLCLHEFAHAVTAWRFGDHDVAVRGYLTLDPRRYSNPVLSLGVPMLFVVLGGIGLPGAAVYVRTSFMTTAQRTLVSLAGPSANLALAVLLLALTRFCYAPTHPVLWAGLAFLAFLQVTAVLLNLLPVPGLDGYGALEPHLDLHTQRALEPVKQFGLLFLLVLFLAPVLNQGFFHVVYWVFELSGVPGVLASAGGRLTRFWSAWF
jgi:Zn-dependent protease